MKIIVAKDYQDMSRKGANIISAQAILKESAVLGLATGSTVQGIYRQLIDWYKKGDVSFSQIRTVNLDEYVGLPPEHPQSYRYYMEENFFSHIDILPANTHVPLGTAADIEGEALRYENLIQSLSGIDLQLLGLGHNGHIGFNEPGAAFEKMTHCVALTEQTIEANARFFGAKEKTPRYAVTMGIKSIMQATRILLCVSGGDKAEILEKALFGPVVPEVPASILQMHPNLTVVADLEAAALLPVKS